MIDGTLPGTALRRLLPPGAWLWLVRPGAAEEATAIGLLLLHRLPGLLVALGWEVVRHG
ncbi:hypothetical protein [Roseococcus sp. SDR]|uniref:hypothetical protein n=1 Tax=Roseococcus sp. SDR TaxID=2835532 RepID=UPI0020C0922E|nr:hypothetical protein [Roseococcus sp. SDR]